MEKINKIFMLGFGIVATALMEILNKERVFNNVFFTIIEPETIHTDLLVMRRYEHIKQYIDEDNIDKLLKNLDDKSLIIDLTVETDSLLFIKKAKECNSFYINTSVENWEDFNNSNRSTETYSDIKENTLLHRGILVENLLRNSRKTRIVNFGMNPGFVSELAKYTIRKYADNKGYKMINGNYGKLCSEMNLMKLIITEYDNTQTNIDLDENVFYNDWSCLGLEAEALDNVMMSLSKKDEQEMLNLGYEIIVPDEGIKNTRIRFLRNKAMDVFENCITYDPNGEIIEYKGYLIPHAEIISLSDFLNFNGDAPTIFYSYRMCDDAISSLDNVCKNGYKPLDSYYPIEKKDVINNCFDSIGVLLVFENGDHFWGGSVCQMSDVDKMNFKYSTPTSMQVAGSVYSGIIYMLDNPNISLNEAETIKSRDIMKKAKKYMGNIFYKYYKV